MKTKIEKLRYRSVIIILFGVLLVISSNIKGQNNVKVGKTPKSVNSVNSVNSINSVNSVNKVSKSENTSTSQDEQSGSEISVQQKVDIDFRPNAKIIVYNTETHIMPSRGNSVEVSVKYIAEAKDEDDLKLLHEAMEKNLMVVSGNNINISLKFYEKYSSIVNPFGSTINIQLMDKSKIKLSKFKITEFKVYLPADMDLSIDAKYSKVNLNFSIEGDLNIKGYDMTMKSKSISRKLDINAKYSKFEFASAGKTKLNLYESKLMAKEFKEVIADSKYSHIYLDNVNKLSWIGYEDEIDIKNVANAKIKGKYCEIEIDENQYLDANLYEGGLKSNTAIRATINAKYLEAEFGKIRALHLIDCYENEYEIVEVDTFISKNGKYNEFEFEKFNSVLKVEGYEDDIELNLVSDNFAKIWVSGKYMDLSLSVSDKVSYKLYGNVQYPNFNIEKSDYKTVLHHKESSRLKFEYFKETDKSKSEIKLEGYEVELDINHQ